MTTSDIVSPGSQLPLRLFPIGPQHFGEAETRPYVEPLLEGVRTMVEAVNRTEPTSHAVYTFALDTLLSIAAVGDELPDYHELLASIYSLLGDDSSCFTEIGIAREQLKDTDWVKAHGKAPGLRLFYRHQYARKRTIDRIKLADQGRVRTPLNLEWLAFQVDDLHSHVDLERRRISVDSPVDEVMYSLVGTYDSVGNWVPALEVEWLDKTHSYEMSRYGEMTAAANLANQRADDLVDTEINRLFTIGGTARVIVNSYGYCAFLGLVYRPFPSGILKSDLDEMRRLAAAAGNRALTLMEQE